jgi:hypothetical protein
MFRTILALAAISVALTFATAQSVNSEDNLSFNPLMTQTVTTDLIAAQHYDVGDVSVWNDANYLYVKYETVSKVYLYATHLHVGLDLKDIPQTWSGNPRPGQFDFGDTYGWKVSEDTFKIPMDSAWVVGTELFIATHACVYTCCGYSETAWGDGMDFPGSNWAMYFKYTVE